MLDTVTELDISVLVGEMEAPKCEHSRHQEKHPDQPATHYMQGWHDGCGHRCSIYAACQFFVDYVRADGPVRCSNCQEACLASEIVRVIGPISNY